jgi:hypothetical protein
LETKKNLPWKQKKTCLGNKKNLPWKQKKLAMETKKNLPWKQQNLPWKLNLLKFLHRLILPMMQSYTQAGEFDVKGKVRSALLDNAIYYGE